MIRFKNVFLSSCAVAVAGTFLLNSQAQAHEHRGRDFREFRQANSDMSRREARELFNNNFTAEGGNSRQSSVPTLSTPNSRADAILRLSNFGSGNHDQMSERIRNQSMQVSSIGAVRLNNGVDLDLTSQTRNITLGRNLFADGASVSITVGGESKTFNAGSQVTAAEYVAVKQVLAGGEQKVSVNLSGIATGGEVDLSALTDGNDVMRAARLVVAENVTTYGDFGKRSDFRLLGDLDNHGTVNALSTNASINHGTIRAEDINNFSGALINSTVNLTMDASGNITNSGTITSAESLTLAAGGALNNSGSVSANKDLNLNAAVVTNAGLLQSTAANVNLNGTATADLIVKNSGGTIAALNAINLRDASYAGTFKSTISGGDLLSRELNLSAGGGSADVFVQQLTGTVNGTGNAAHVSSATDNLNLGTVCLTGDPTYYNTAGSITVVGNLTSAEAIVLVASGDIILNAGVVVTAALPGQGQDITLIAGADFTVSGGNDAPTLPQMIPTPGSVSLSGKASTTGGSINLNNSAVIDARPVNLASPGDGGNVSLFAFAGKTAGSGVVNFPTGSVNTSSGSTGAAGDVLIVAGAKSGDAIILGGVTSTGNSGTGDLTVVTSQPVSSVKGERVEYNEFGARTSSAALTFGKLTKSNIVSDQISVFDVNISGDSLVRSGGEISIFNHYTAVGNLEFQAVNSIVGDTNSTLTSSNGVVWLSSTKGSIGADGAEVIVVSPELVATAKGDIFLESTQATTLNISATAGGDLKVIAPATTLNTVFPLAAGGTMDLTVFRYINVNLSTASDFIIETTDSTYTFDGFLGNLNSVSIKSAGGIGISNTQTYNFINVKNAVTLEANGDIFAAGTGKKAIKFDAVSNDDILLLGAGDMTVLNAEASAGSISIVTALDGKLTIDGTVTANDFINIAHAGESKSSKIIFAANSVVETTAKSMGMGAINILLGDLSPLYAGPPIANIDIVETSGDVILSGSGVKAKGPVNTLTAQGANLSINNGFSAGNISFGGNVQITADPPVAPGAPTTITRGPVRGNGKIFRF